MAHKMKKHEQSSNDRRKKAVDCRKEALRHESEKINLKINEAYEKLAAKLQSKADKAKSNMDTKKDGQKRDILRRRFELYADAATDLKLRHRERLSASRQRLMTYRSQGRIAVTDPP